tara:strand:- start:23 stop:343 length:321 start_codon:yes stop_codon:yes gene_type:complete
MTSLLLPRNWRDLVLHGFANPFCTKRNSLQNQISFLVLHGFAKWPLQNGKGTGGGAFVVLHLVLHGFARGLFCKTGKTLAVYGFPVLHLLHPYRGLYVCNTTPKWI